VAIRAYGTLGRKGHAAKMGEHRILKKPPKQVAVVDQRSCSGCAGSPVCVTYCETVAVRNQVVDAIRTVKATENPFELAVVELDLCIGCALCAKVCPWEAIEMIAYDDSLELEQKLTLIGYSSVSPCQQQEAGEVAAGT
jgi:Pyruvate/2-oxoacid:ferredoxin oxidoreductase delta subunit